MVSFAERRAQNIEANNSELAKINAAKKLKVPKAEKPKSRPLASRPRVKEEANYTSRREGLRATRQSSRIAGLNADDESLKRKLEEETVSLDKVPVKKSRVDGDVSLGSISLEGKRWQNNLEDVKKMGLGIPVRGAQPGERTFTDEDVKETTDGDLKNLRVRMSSLKLYEKFPVPGKRRRF
jgi:WD repeat-containing protein 76